MTDNVPHGALPHGTAHPAADAPVPGGHLPAAASYPPDAYAKAVPAGFTQAPPATWPRWFSLSAAAGIIVGIIWWFTAPGGAFYGDGTDYSIWLVRDLLLGGLGVLAGLVAAIMLVRAGRKQQWDGSLLRFAAVMVGGLLGSAVAWRIGVFAGDLFQKPPANMANPSMVFSLRSGSVMLLWPLAGAIGVFLYTLYNYLFGPAARPKEG